MHNTMCIRMIQYQEKNELKKISLQNFTGVELAGGPASSPQSLAKQRCKRLNASIVRYKEKQNACLMPNIL